MDKKTELTYQEIVDDATSDVKLRCTKGYQGTSSISPGQLHFYKYYKGEVLPRNHIFLDPKHWEIA